MEEDIEKYKKDCDLLELTDDELISEAKATLIDAMNRKSDGFRRPEKVALVAIENLIARNKELEGSHGTAYNAGKAFKQHQWKEKITKLLEKLDKEEKQELKGAKGQDRYFIKQIYQAKRSTIQELLQEN